MRRSTTATAAKQGNTLSRQRRRQIGLSSGESEFHAIVRGPAPAVGMKSMAGDYGNEVKVALETDSVSGSGMSLRLGAGKVRHVDTQWLWAQGVFHRRGATIRKIPGVSNEADFVTIFLGGETIQ